ncbi:hypothetical protein VTO73DRAFT_1898 [Trametes versicolor]
MAKKLPSSRSSSPSPPAVKRPKNPRRIVESDAEDSQEETAVMPKPPPRRKAKTDIIVEISTDDDNSDDAQQREESVPPKPGMPKPRKPRGKGKPKVTEPLTEDEAPSVKGKKTWARRIEWKTHFVPAQAYLASRFREWNIATKNSAAAVVIDAAQYVVKHWDFTGYPAEDVRKAVRNWCNHKKQFDKAGEPIATTRKSKKTHPLLARMKGRGPAASTLWARAHPDRVDEELGEGDNIGDRQKVVARLFNNLPAEEKEYWRRKVLEAKEERAGNPDQCFINQIDIADVLADVMQELNGYGCEQIGAAVFHLQFAVRDIEGKIESKEFTCGHMVDEQPFMEFEGGTPQSESDRWARFIGLSLPPNPQRRNVRLKYDTTGHPLLPQWNDDWNKTQSADVFKVFLDATWNSAVFAP